MMSSTKAVIEPNSSMNGKAKQAIGAEEVKVLADRGYCVGDEVLACERTGILPAMPRADTPG